MDKKDPRKYTCPKCGKDTTCLVCGLDGSMCWDCFDKGNDKEGR
jgi:hypothetical protein